MKATIEREGCIGCGLCAEICPEVFQLGDDNLAEVHGAITPGNQNDAHEAEHSCPVAVIQISQ